MLSCQRLKTLIPLDCWMFLGWHRKCTYLYPNYMISTFMIKSILRNITEYKSQVTVLKRWPTRYSMNPSSTACWSNMSHTMQEIGLHYETKHQQSYMSHCLVQPGLRLCIPEPGQSLLSFANNQSYCVALQINNANKDYYSDQTWSFILTTYIRLNQF